MTPPEGGRRGRPSFVDVAHIEVRAGHGGRGAVSFRREPFVPRGGPDGGDGGRGGSVILEATNERSSLAAYANRRTWRAGDGRPGAGALKAGRAGADLRLPVPPGTVIYEAATGAALADLDREGAEFVVAAGGAGGRGNVHFKSPVDRAPQLSEPGRPGLEASLRLELKLIADAGLVGPPNAGKSSLLRAISAATPKVGAYPFTTLDPELGVASLPEGGRLVVADIPGLIAGAAGGAGLGLRFLRHVERTRVLVFLVAGDGPDPWAELDTVRREVREYSAVLAERPALVCVNKLDLPATRALKARGGHPDVHWCSALTGEGVAPLLAAIERLVASAPAPAALPVTPPTVRLQARRAAPEPASIRRHAWGFSVSGAAVERLVAATDFDSPAALARFQVRLDRLGVSAGLEAAGAAAGDTVRVGGREFEYRP